MMVPGVFSSKSSFSSHEIVHSQIWYSDGSVILQAESLRFRVHASLLSHQSRVLANMFVNGSPNVETTLEQCPVVFLTDRAQDVEYLLRAIYDPSTKSKREFAEIAAWLRLGRKYEMKEIYQRALRILTAEFPNTLEKWDRRVVHIKYHPSNYIDCINLCRELNIFSPIPIAFYSWLHHLHETKDLENIFFGVPRPDGTIAILSPEDQHLSVTAFDKLLFTQWIAFGWLNNEPLGCFSPQKCERLRMKIKDQLTVPTPKLTGLRKAPSPNTFTRGMCDRCSAVANESYEWGRAEIWRRMPSNFGLPPWESLNNLLD
ncbi:hypothetical protein AX16_008459 [Volvariella volvacea WC 439]|nr:hypothetical protein AX16_008459 [Volvariella volvacea WC 439]